jgi:hypothetical protein
MTPDEDAWLRLSAQLAAMNGLTAVGVFEPRNPESGLSRRMPLFLDVKALKGTSYRFAIHPRKLKPTISGLPAPSSLDVRDYECEDLYCWQKTVGGRSEVLILFWIYSHPAGMSDFQRIAAGEISAIESADRKAYVVTVADFLHASCSRLQEPTLFLRGKRDYGYRVLTPSTQTLERVLVPATTTLRLIAASG